MSIQLAATPLTISILRILRSSQIPASNLCLQCLYKSIRSPQPTFTRRRFVSVAPHRPQDLAPHAAPRKAGIPETSLASGGSILDETRSTIQHPSVPPAPIPHVSMPEGKAQKSSGVTITSSTSSETASEPSLSSRPQRKSKLRPRKAAMTLSPSAVGALKELLAQPEPKMIRVGVKNRGCSGLAYNLEYVEKAGAFDEAVEQEGVKVLIDSKALFSIIGSEMDWVEDKLSRRFVFKNPNITEQCGCGESFSIS